MIVVTSNMTKCQMISCPNRCNIRKGKVQTQAIQDMDVIKKERK